MHEKPTLATRCVIYAAKSTADERDSIPGQIARCREHAERHGWEVIEPPFCDEAVSAYRRSRGDGLAEAKSAAARLAAHGDDVVLLVFATDRLARGDGKQAAHLVEYVIDGMRAGYRVESVTEDMGGEMALVLAALYGERGHHDSKVKGEHVRRGVRQRVEKHRRAHGGIAPYGYRIERDRNDEDDLGQLVLVADEAEIVRRIYSEYLAGKGVRAIASGLIADKVPPPSAKKPAGTRRRAARWDGSQVSNMLRQPLYAGLVHLNGDTFDGEHEPIVDAEMWRKVERLRTARRQSQGTAAGRPTIGRHLLVKGLLRCGLCGEAMRPRTYRHRDLEVYVCSVHDGHRAGRACPMKPIDRSAVDEAIFEHFAATSLDLDGTRAQLGASANRALREVAARRESAEHEAMLADERLARVRRAFQDGRLEPEDWNEQREQLTAEKTAAEAELARCLDRELEIERERSLVDSEAEILTRLSDLRAQVAGTISASDDLDALRAALASVFQRIDLVVSDDGELDLVPYVRTGWIPGLEEAAALQRAAAGEDVEGFIGPRARLDLCSADNVDTTSSLSAGTNALLKLGASPLTAATDVLASFGIEPEEAPVAAVEGAAARLLELVRSAPAGADELSRQAGIDAAEAARVLVELELAGLVSAADGVYRAVAPAGR